MTSNPTHKNLLAIGSLLAVATQLDAAVISWQAEDLFQGTTTETFVSTVGDLAVAYNATNLTGAGDTGVDATVNGVTFVATEAGTTLTGANGESITLNSGGNNEGAFGDGQFTSNGNIFNLLKGGSFNIGSVTLGGLTIGETYEVQIYSHDGRSSRDNAVVGFSDGVNAGAAVTANLNNQNTGAPTSGRTGDVITGTFTANSTSQSFDVFGDGNSTDGISFVSGNSQSAINAIQLRVVPEPSSALLLGLAGAGFLLRRRK